MDHRQDAEAGAHSDHQNAHDKHDKHATNKPASKQTKRSLLRTVVQNEYMKKSGLKGCVISVSGGIDSAVTYALCLEAAKLPASPIKRVLGIAQPVHR